MSARGFLFVRRYFVRILTRGFAPSALIPAPYAVLRGVRVSWVGQSAKEDGRPYLSRGGVFSC
jgi:hypothetical protein